MWCFSLALALASEPALLLSDELSAEIAALEQALGQREEEALRLRLAEARIEALQPQTAVELLQPLLDADRGHLEARRLRARAFLDLGDPGRGLIELELLRHLHPGHVASEEELALESLLRSADELHRGLPDVGDHEQLRGCLDQLDAGQALEAWQVCLETQLVEDLQRDLADERMVWAAEEASRSLAEQLFRNAWMEPRASRLVELEDGRVELWVWTEVRVEQGLFEHLIQGGLCAESCSQLALGGAWRRLDAQGREELLAANEGGSLWQVQRFVSSQGPEGGVEDVVLLSGQPAVDNLAHVLADGVLRAGLLGFEAPPERDKPDPGSISSPPAGPPEAPRRSLWIQLLTVLVALGLVALSAWIWRGGGGEDQGG